MTYRPAPQSEIRVTRPSDLAGTLRSDVVYVVDAPIDMTAEGPIEVPAGGVNITGQTFAISSLGIDADTLFVDPAGGNAGPVIIRDMELWATGVGGQLFDLDNAGASQSVELVTVNLGRFSAQTPSVGRLTGYRQLFMTGSAVINVADGLEFGGTWAGGFAITDTILLAIGAGVTVFKSGTALDFQGSSISNINAVPVDTAATVFGFSDANFSRDQGFTLDGARFPVGGLAAPNMTEGSTRRFFKDCTGVRNTFSGGLWRITTTAATTISATATPVKMAGTTIYDDLVYMTGVNDNEFVFVSTIPKDYRVTGWLQLEGDANDEVTAIVRHWDDSASAYLDLGSFTKAISNLVGGNDVADYVLFATVEMDENDRVELWVQNESGTADVTALNGYLAMDVRVG